MDEQQEAAISEEIRKIKIEKRSTLFKVRLDLFHALKAEGLSPVAVNAVVGKIVIHVPDKQYGEEIYNTALEVSSRNIGELYREYLAEMNEEIFCQAASFMFHIPDIQ